MPLKTTQLTTRRRLEEEIPDPTPNTSAYVPTEFQVIYNSGDNISTSDQPNIHIDTSVFDELLENQKKILENQRVMQETQRTIMEKGDKNGRLISNLAVLVDDCFKRLSRQIQKSSDVVLLKDASNFEKDSFTIKPLNSVKELEELERLLCDETEKRKLEKRFEFLCSKAPGNGVTCAYKLLDILFSREFLCKCSWSGGSRGNTTKIPLKGFKNVLDFFYDMIHLWDPVYTSESNEKFFKIVTKNATKRLEIKDLRASTKRKRPEKKVDNEKKKKTEKSQEGAENVEKAEEDQENAETAEENQENVETTEKENEENMDEIECENNEGNQENEED